MTTTTTTPAPPEEIVVELYAEEIVVKDQHRRDLGDIAGLVESIENVGLIHPIVVTPDYELVCGTRRLEAMKSLGWELIPVTVIHTLSGAAHMLEAQRDENTCRKDLTPTEAANLRRAMAQVLAPLAQERKGGRPPKDSETGAKLAPVSGKTRDIGARGTGYGHATLDKVDKTAEIAHDESQPAGVREIAHEALAEMDRTRNVDKAYRKAQGAKAAAERNPSLNVEDTQSVQDAAYLHEFSRVLAQVQSLIAFDAERIAQLADHPTLDSLDHARDSLTAFTAKVRTNVKPIRRVK